MIPRLIGRRLFAQHRFCFALALLCCQVAQAICAAMPMRRSVMQADQWPIIRRRLDIWCGSGLDVWFDSGLDVWFGSGSITFAFGTGKVIKGWDYGLKGAHLQPMSAHARVANGLHLGMRKGGERTLTIPPSLAYGNNNDQPSAGPGKVSDIGSTMHS